MRIFLNCSFLLLFSFSFFAQTITIFNQETKIAIENVELIEENSQNFATTDFKGQASIYNFNQKNKIFIIADNYQTKILSFKEIKDLDFKIYLEVSNLNLNEVVVAANRWKQFSDKISSKIISVSQKEINFQNPQTAADLLGISRNVFVQKSQQGGGSPMIRGFATNRLIYTIDGIRMNTAIFRSGNIQNVINLDPFAIENTEILFGASSVNYGSDAIGGVMSFQTLTPQLSTEDKTFVKGKAITRYSSANQEKTAHFDVNVGWEKWAFVTSFSSWDFDHLRQGSNGPLDYIKNVYPERENNTDIAITQDNPLLQIPSAYSQINLMQKARFNPNKNWDFQYGFHLSATSPYGRYDRHNRFKNGNLRYAEWDYGPQKWMMNNFAISNFQQNTLFDQLMIKLALQNFEESRIDRNFNNANRNITQENVKAYSFNLDFSKNINLKNTTFYGFEYIYNDVSSTGSTKNIVTNVEKAAAARYPNSNWESVAVFINNDYKIYEKLTLQAGIRYNYFKLNADFSNNLSFYPLPYENSTLNNASWTGNIGGIYKPNEKLIFKLNFGSAFRAPNVDDMGKIFDSGPKTVTVPNTNLKAENAYNFDFGLAKIIGKNIKIDLTGYYTLLNNAMVKRNFQFNGLDEILYNGELSQVQAIQNAAFAKVYGLQAGVEIKFVTGFKFLTDVNFQKGEEELDNGEKSSSRHAAPFFGTSRLRYNYKKWLLEINANYQAEKSFDNLAQEEREKTEIYAKDSNGNNYSPAWYTINLKAMCQISENFSINAGLENITDQRYRPYSSGISGAGRNFVLSVKAVF